MIKVTVLDNLIPAELLLLAHPAVLDQLLYNLASGARDFWIKRAGERLHSTARDYINGIQEVVLAPGQASIALVGTLPHMLEEGMGPFDMHDTLLGPNVPVAGPGQRGKHVNAKGQFYRAIPFRHQTPQSSGKGGGAPMGSQYFKGVTQAQTDLGKAIHKAAKKLKPSVGMPGAPMQWGGRLPEGVGGVAKLKPHHSTDIYSGMVRQQKAYGKATQTTYTTFRTISEGQPDKWLHPGLGALNLTDEVQKHVEELVPKAVEALLGGLS